MNAPRMRHLILTLIILAVSALGFGALKATKTPPARSSRSVPPPPVRIRSVQPEISTVTIQGSGTVRPVRTTRLAAQVAGRVEKVSPALVDGGRVQRGEVLVRLDPADYRLILTLREAELRETEKNLELIREDAEAARDEWQRLHGDEPPPPLVAKEPHLQSAEAALDAARARLRQAELALERTEIRSPFEGLVSEKLVERGQYVAPGTAVARIDSTEACEIALPLETRELAWLNVPGLTGEAAGSPARIRARFGGTETVWSGRVVRAGARLDEGTRLVSVVVRVERPYDRLPPLALGLFVGVELEGLTLEGATRLPRVALQARDEVWLVNDESRLELRSVPVVQRSAETVLIHPGLPTGSRIVLSPPAGAIDGMEVQVLEETGTIGGDPS